ncbi:Transcriptional regulator, PadR family [Microbacterium esteraromaticum]|uniref:Transcriptional regulator, PadR family n=1 Tax=Microbacterium esteraromaticum TaxID=57043 RepID=A0A1R4IF32_9MICO|nr:helix-turn-helix transcriptional regulator [Microbacterium esteraromaticum]SJN18441.1 Transcriptional regulator, PadR family [Microbacterium esteraromaticum]
MQHLPRSNHTLAQLSEGATSLKVPTLYAALERLEHSGLIHSDGEEVVDGRARRYFAITEAGSETLREEAARLAVRVRVATERLAAVRARRRLRQVSRW